MVACALGVDAVQIRPYGLRAQERQGHRVGRRQNVNVAIVGQLQRGQKRAAHFKPRLAGAHVRELKAVLSCVRARPPWCPHAHPHKNKNQTKPQ